MSTMPGNSAAMAARDWAQTLVPYRRASAARAILELAVTVRHDFNISVVAMRTVTDQDMALGPAPRPWRRGR